LALPSAAGAAWRARARPDRCRRGTEPSRNGRGAGAPAKPHGGEATPTRRRRTGATRATTATARTRRPDWPPTATRHQCAHDRRDPEGGSAARSAPAEIRKALQDNGVAMAFTSIRHALGQLEQRNAAEQVGDSKTWRHRG